MQHFKASKNTHLPSNIFSQTQPIPHFELSTDRNLANNRFSQTQPIQHLEAGTNTNLASKILSQTQPIQHFEAGTNTNLASNRFSQTKQRNANTQSTNTPSQNQICTLNESCQCEDDEIDHTGIQYRSIYARQLQQSETIPKHYTQQPVSNYISHTEKPSISQTESSTIYHIP